VINRHTDGVLEEAAGRLAAFADPRDLIRRIAALPAAEAEDPDGRS
jgi:hypothetical protein